MRLHGMAQALREQSKDENARDLGFEERFALLVDRQMTPCKLFCGAPSCARMLVSKISTIVPRVGSIKR